MVVVLLETKHIYCSCIGFINKNAGVTYLFLVVEKVKIRFLEKVFDLFITKLC